MPSLHFLDIHVIFVTQCGIYFSTAPFVCANSLPRKQISLISAHRVPTFHLNLHYLHQKLFKSMHFNCLNHFKKPSLGKVESTTLSLIYPRLLPSNSPLNTQPLLWIIFQKPLLKLPFANLHVIDIISVIFIILLLLLQERTLLFYDITHNLYRQILFHFWR